MWEVRCEGILGAIGFTRKGRHQYFCLTWPFESLHCIDWFFELRVSTRWACPDGHVKIRRRKSEFPGTWMEKQALGMSGRACQVTRQEKRASRHVDGKLLLRSRHLLDDMQQMIPECPLVSQSTAAFYRASGWRLRPRWCLSAGASLACHR